jgi:hypothetical protein
LVIIEIEPGVYHLLYCDAQWQSLTDTCHASVDDAKAQAAYEYEGIAQAWRVLPAEA